jgi:hypothetical protein
VKDMASGAAEAIGSIFVDGSVIDQYKALAEEIQRVTVQRNNLQESIDSAIYQS